MGRKVRTIQQLNYRELNEVNSQVLSLITLSLINSIGRETLSDQ